MSKMLKPLIVEQKGSYVKVKPKLVVSISYQNIQKSPSYDSGYALRFPRIKFYRPDRSTSDIATLKEVKKEAMKGRAPVGMG
jgi:DNA ligase-1